MAGITRLFLDGDQALALRKPQHVALLGSFFEKWKQSSVEIIVLTRGKIEPQVMELQKADLRKHLEDVLSLEDPQVFPAIGEMLMNGLRKEGWVPREQLLVDSSISALTSIWKDQKGEARRFALAHTLRLPEGATTLTEAHLEAINARLFMAASKQTSHSYQFVMDGQSVLDPVDSLNKMKLDHMDIRARKADLEQMSSDAKMACLAGRPDFAELIGEPPVEPDLDGAPPPPQPSAKKEQKNPQPRVEPAKEPKTPMSNGRPPSPPPVAKKQSADVDGVVLDYATEGMKVKIGTGKQAGSVGTIMKVVRDGLDARYRVQLDNGQSSWTTVVRSVDGGGGARSAAPPPMDRNIVSPLMAALQGGQAGGKGNGKVSSAAQPPKHAGGEKDPFPEGTNVEVLVGKEKGRMGTVIKISGEGAEKKYRVQMEAGRGAIWVAQVGPSSRELEQEEIKTKITDLYEVEKKKLGQGAFGSVTKVVSKSTRLTRAMKSCPKPMVKNVDVIWREVAFMKRLDHPNIIKIYDTFEDHRNVYLIMELCLGGELFDRIVDAQSFTEQQSAHVMQQALRGVYYMHSKRIVHRDLKPENFLLTMKGAAIESAILKVIDFGLAHDFPAEGEWLRTRTGSAYYVAPQVLEGKYNEAADMWSFGVILYVLLCGKPPFDGEQDPEIFKKVKVGKFEFEPELWMDISQDAKDLITGMLMMDPPNRVTAGEALKHTWMKNKAPKAVTGRRGSVISNLRQFQSQSKLKKIALQVIANQMSEQQIKALRDTFLVLDENGDGLLTVAELKAGISKLGMDETPADLQAIMEQVDANASGSIDYTEFISASMDKKTYLKDEFCWAAFRTFDRNGDGKITKEEMAEVLKDNDLASMVSGDIGDVLNDCDRDGDGEIDFEEFKAMMQAGA